MPIYEYVCLDCRNSFDALRPMAKADSPIACEQCESEHTSRALSVFYAQSNGKPMAATQAAGGCACGGACSCSSLN